MTPTTLSTKGDEHLLGYDEITFNFVCLPNFDGVKDVRCVGVTATRGIKPHTGEKIPPLQ